MTRLAGFPDRLRSCLEAVSVSSSTVRVYSADSGNYQYFGKLVSPDFEHMNEAERQGLVWDRILERLDDRDQERIAFIYTDAPSELKDYPTPVTSAASHTPASS